MPNRLMLEIGANTYSVPLGGTVTQIRNALQRVAKSYRIPIEGRTNQEVIEDILTHIKKDLRNTSVAVQREEQVQAQLALIEETINTDNNL